MALGTPDFDTTLLPDSVQALNPNQEGYINCGGSLNPRIGPRSFEIQNGDVTIVQNGQRFSPMPADFREVLAKLNVPKNASKPNDFKVIQEGQFLKVVVLEGGRQKSVAEFHAAAFHERLTAATAAADAKEAREKAFVDHWTRERGKCIDPVTQGFVDFMRSSSNIQAYETQENGAITKAAPNATALTELETKYRIQSTVLEMLAGYEKNLQAAATREGIPLADARFQGLLVGNPEERKAMAAALTRLRASVEARLSQLGDLGNFKSRWEGAWDKLKTELHQENGDSLPNDINLEEDADIRKIISAASEDIGRGLNGETEDQKKNFKETLFKIKESLIRIAKLQSKIEREAEGNGINLKDPSLADLKLKEFFSEARMTDINTLETMLGEVDKILAKVKDFNAFNEKWKNAVEAQASWNTTEPFPVKDLLNQSSLQSIEKDLENLIKTGVLSDATKLPEALDHVEKLLARFAFLKQMEQGITAEAAAKGIDVSNQDDPNLSTAIRAVLRFKLSSKIPEYEKKKTELQTLIAYEKARIEALRTALTTLNASNEEMRSTLETISSKKDLAEPTIAFPLLEAAGALHGGTFNDLTPTKNLQDAQTELEENTQKISRLKAAYEAAKTALEANPIPGDIPFQKGRVAAHAQEIAVLGLQIEAMGTALTQNAALATRLTGILSHRTDVEARVKKANTPPPPGNFEKAWKAVRHNLPDTVLKKGYEGYRAATEAQTRAREAESNYDQPANSRTVPDMLNADRTRFPRDLGIGDGKIYYVDTGDYLPPTEYPATVDYLNSQNTDPEVSYVLDTTDPTEPFIREVKKVSLEETLGDKWKGLLKDANENGSFFGEAAARRRADKKKEKAERKARKKIAEEIKLDDLVTEMRKESKTKDEARRVARTILQDPSGKNLTESEADKIFDELWEDLEAQKNSRWTRTKEWISEKAPKAWEYTKNTAAPAAWNGVKSAAKWTYEHLPDGKTVVKAAGIGVAGLAVGAGALSLGVLYAGTKLAQGTLSLGGNILREGAHRAPGVAKALLKTAVSPVMAAGTAVSSPVKGTWNGLKAGWNYAGKPNYKSVRGIAAPVHLLGNVFKWGWHKAKAVPSSIVAGAAGLTIGAVQGVTDGIVHDIGGVKWKLPVPGFMEGKASAHGSHETTHHEHAHGPEDHGPKEDHGDHGHAHAA